MMSNEPGFSLKAVDHVSLTVDDIESAVEFYTRVFNAKLLYRLGPMEFGEMEDGRDWSEAHINIHGAEIIIAMLKLSPNLNLELFQYIKPESTNKKPPGNADVGSRHVCFEVDNIEAAIKYLEENGCHALEGPILMEDGPCPASKFWYVLDPFNHQFELVEYL